MPRITLTQRVREMWRKLSRLDARPNDIAAGFSIGICAGILPLNPSPILVATAVAWLLKSNVPAAVAGGAAALLYLPLLPLLWLAEYRVGTWVLPMQHPLTLDQIRWRDVLHQGWDVYAAMCVGTIIIAIPVTWLTYLVVQRLAQRWARQTQATAKR